MFDFSPYFVNFLVNSGAIPFKNCLIWIKIISFSLKNKKFKHALRIDYSPHYLLTLYQFDNLNLTTNETKR